MLLSLGKDYMKFEDFWIIERERLPLFLPVILGIGIIFGTFFPFSHWSHIGIAACIAFLLIIILYNRDKVLSCAIFVFSLGIYIVQTGGILETGLLTHKKFITKEYDNIEFVAVVASMDETHPVMRNMRRVTFKNAQIENLSFIKTIKMTCSGKMSDDILPGDIVRGRGKLMPFKPPAIPGAFDQLQYNSLIGIDAIGIVYHIEKLRETYDFRSKFAKIRCELTKSVLKRMSDNNIAGAVTCALLTGDKSTIRPEIRDKFINSGTAHILAISGLHMSIVASVIFFILYKILQYLSYFYKQISAKRISAIVTIPITFLYLALSGFSPSATRAFIMTTVFLIGVICGRGVLSLRSVAVAAFLILLFNPGSIFLVSFQLSFCAVVALISFYETFQCKIDNFKINSGVIAGNLGFYVLATLISTLIASIATLPISIAVFNRLSLSGMLGNLIAIPVVSFLVIPVGLFAFLFGKFIDFPVEVLAYILNKLYVILSWISEIPGFNLVVKSPQMPALYAVILGGIILCLLRSKARLFGFVPICLGVVCWSFRNFPDIMFIPRSEVACFIENANFLTTSLRSGRRASLAIQRTLGFSGKLMKKEFHSSQWEMKAYPNGLYIWSNSMKTKQLADRKHPYCPAHWTDFCAEIPKKPNA